MRLPALARTLQAGFSLMEIVLGLMLLGILSVVGSTMITSGFFTTMTLSDEHLAHSAARYAMERMTREIRQIQFNPTTGVVSISSTMMGSTQLSFVKSTMSGTENVTLKFTSNADPALGTIQMSYFLDDISPANVLTRNIKSFSFTYLADSNGTIATSANAVRFIRIDMSVVSSSTSVELPMRTLIKLRNT